MSSLRKIDSCRKNGALSHGPVTPEGKDQFAMNGLRHGFAASRIVLATEERAQFDVLRESFIQIHDPGNDVETALVDQMVVAQWRLLRMWAGEAAILDRTIATLFPSSAPAPEPTPCDQFCQAS